MVMSVFDLEMYLEFVGVLKLSHFLFLSFKTRSIFIDLEFNRSRW